MSDSSVVEGPIKPGSSSSNEDAPSAQHGLSPSDLRGPSQAPKTAVLGEAEVTAPTSIDHQAPAVPGKRREEFDICVEAFKTIQVIQHNQMYRIAFMHYVCIDDHFCSDALYWLRLAECCVYARYQRKEQQPEGEALDGLAACFLDDRVPNNVEEELDDLGMTVDYAEIALRNCEALMTLSPSLEGMMAHVKTLIAFLHLKALSVSRAQLYLNDALRYNPEGTFLITALVMQIYIHLQQGKIAEAITFYEGMTDSQRSECKKCCDQTVRSILNIS